MGLLRLLRQYFSPGNDLTALVEFKDTAWMKQVLWPIRIQEGHIGNHTERFIGRIMELKDQAPGLPRPLIFLLFKPRYS